MEHLVSSRGLIGRSPNARRSRGAERDEDDLPIQPEWNLTRNQLLLWLAQRLQPRSTLFNEVVTVALTGPLDAERFQRALEATVAASDSLRSVFTDPRGWPERRVRPQSGRVLEHVDLSRSPAPRDAFLAWLERRCERVPDLEACLVDSALVRLEEDEYVWFWNQHQLVADGWSTSLVYENVCEYYQQIGRPTVAATPHALPFADFVAYEAALRATSRYANARRYWQRKTARGVDALFSRGADLAGSTKVVRVSRPLTAAGTERFRAAAREPGIFAVSDAFAQLTVLVMAMVLYLHRLAGSEYVVVGTALHNRPTRQFQRTIGSFAHFLPLGVEVHATDTIRTLATKLEVELLESMQHQSFVPRNPLGRPTYDVFVNYVLLEDVCRHVAGRDGAATATWHGSGQSPCPLGLSAYAVSASAPMTLVFDFNASVFPADARTRLVTEYLALLDRIGTELDAPLREL